MQIEHVTERVKSLKALRKVLDAIEAGDMGKPDWIDLRGDARLDRASPDEQAALLKRIHPATKRGFKANNIRGGGKRHFLEYWCRVAQHGFHDFAEDCWMKCYDSPHVQSYDYISAYREGGIPALDAFMVYSAVLGTWEYSVEDFKATELCKDIQTVVEPMAGSAEFCHAGHFFEPDMRFVMFDLDESAKAHVEEKFWHPQTKREFFIGDALKEETWKKVREASVGQSLSYIGKQSQNYFNAKQLLQLMKWATKYTDYFILEVSEPYIVDEEPALDDLTRREMKGAGFRTALDDDDDEIPNPLTNSIDFRLVVWDDEDHRVLFEYMGWTGWQPPTLTAFGELLDLDVRYFHSGECEFLPVTEDVDTSDVRENNTFMLFRRKTDADA